MKMTKDQWMRLYPKLLAAVSIASWEDSLDGGGNWWVAFVPSLARKVVLNEHYGNYRVSVEDVGAIEVPGHEHFHQEVTRLYNDVLWRPGGDADLRKKEQEGRNKKREAAQASFLDKLTN